MTNPVSRAKMILLFYLTFLFFFWYFSVLCQGAGAAEVEVGAAAEREEGEEGNSCSQCVSQQFVSVLCGKFP